MLENTLILTSYILVNLKFIKVLLPLQYDKDKKESNVLKIPIVFTPREFMYYEEIITLDINNLYKMDVKIQGEGIQFKLELDKTEDQHIDFGVLRVSQESIKTVSLMNYSKKAISITFDTGNQISNLQKYFISLSPIKEFTIQVRLPNPT